MAKALKLWRQQNIGNLALRLAIANEVLLFLDAAQEHRTLTTEELEFHKYLKAKSVGLVAIQRARARQHSRLTWIHKGDACTRLFMLHANNREWRLHIPALIAAQELTNNHQQKEEIIYNHFVELLGAPQVTMQSLNWTNLGYQPHNLVELESPFKSEEIERVIMGMPAEKAPGPDGFIRVFYKKFWSIVGADLVNALQASIPSGPTA